MTKIRDNITRMRSGAQRGTLATVRCFNETLSVSPAEDLLIASSVRRIDPVTGEFIEIIPAK